MTPRDEGVIKFNCNWKEALPLPQLALQDLIYFRQKLYHSGLIGVYPDGIGFGNLSCRNEIQKHFIISGSQTGHLAEVTSNHFALITEYSIEENSLTCEGPIKASSESLTHAMIYETFSKATAVIHVHSPQLWKKLKHTIPTSGETIPYGTPPMANEIKRLANECRLEEHQILVMAGHEDGVITFGKNLREAYLVLMQYMN